MRCVTAVGCMFLALLVTGTAQGSIIQGFPDFNASSAVTTTYDASTDALDISGFLSQYTEADGVTSHLAAGTYALTAEIDGTGALQNGTLTLTGGVDLNDDNVPDHPLTTLLLEVDLTELEHSGTGNGAFFVFTGDVTGGLFQTDFGPLAGSKVQLGTSDFAGVFTGDFQGSLGTADTYAPEPTSLLLLAAGGFALLRRRR